MSLHQQYLVGLTALAREGRIEPLKAVVWARVQGEKGPIFGLVSPSLERDEPDTNAILYLVYSTLLSQRDSKSVEHLRRAATELLMAGLSAGGDLDSLRAVARLVGHFRVVDSEELRQLLTQQLYGFLESGFEHSWDRLIELESDALERATLALDVWLAVTPILPDWPSHHRNRVEDLVNASLNALRNKALPLEPRLRFLLLAFRMLVKVKPETAGAHSLWLLCERIEAASEISPEVRHRWLAACRHQGVVFAADPDLRSAFREGVRQFTRWFADFRHQALPLFRQSLDKLDRLSAEVSWPRIEMSVREIHRPLIAAAGEL